MKRSLKNIITLVLMLLTVSFTGARADTENAGKYFRVTHDFNGPEQPYVEFEFAYYDGAHNPDILMQCELGVIVNKNQKVKLAYMSKGCGNMSRHNIYWGAIELVSGRDNMVSENRKLCIATARYYPTAEAMENGNAIYLKGIWNTDNDDDRENDYSIDVSQKVKFNRGLFSVPVHASLSFNGANYELEYQVPEQSKVHFTSDFDAKVQVYDKSSQTVEPRKVGEYVYYGLMDHSSTVFSMKSEKVYADNKAYAAQLYLTRQVIVKNGSPGEKYSDECIIEQNMRCDQTVTVEYTVPNRVKSCSIDRAKNGDNVLTFTMKNDTPMEIQVYRSQGEQIEVVGFLNYNGRKDKLSWQDMTSNPFEGYVYFLVAYAPEWEYHTYQHNLAFNHSVSPFTFEGQGLLDQPYLIQSALDLNLLSRYVNEGRSQSKSHWALMANVTIDDETHPWMAIGTPNHPFGGVFEGGGNTVTLQINNEVELQGSLFGVIEDAEIHNLKVDGNIRSAARYAAGFAGRSRGAIFSNCLSAVTIETVYDNLAGRYGGFVGAVGSNHRYFKPTYFNDCVFEGKLLCSSKENAGGFVGWANNGTADYCEFNRCLNKGTFSADASPVYCDQFAVGNSTVNNSYFLNPMLRESLPDSLVSRLTEGQKGLALLDALGTDCYQFTAGDYPYLKLFSPYGQNYDIQMSPAYPPTNRRTFTNVDVEFIRPYEEGQYYTQMLPYTIEAIRYAVWGKCFAFTEFSADEDGKAYAFFNEVTDTIRANTPYVFRPELSFNAKNVKNVRFEGVDQVPDASVAPDTLGMVGTYQRIIVPSGAYGYSAGIGNIESGTFVVARDSVSLPPFSCYLWLGKEAQAYPEIIAVFVDAIGQTTGIEKLVRDEEREGLYYIDGTRLTAPRKGINIINGRKVYIK